MFRNNFNFLQNIRNTGFGDNPETENWTIFDKDGSPNVKLKGMRRQDRFSLYHHLLNISWFKFFGLALLYYIVTNFVFALIYFALSKTGDTITFSDSVPRFWDCFFFSTHTLTTVGYGNVHPVGFFTNIVASFEMFLGLLNIAIWSGLMYGKFSKPVAYVRFSDNLLVNLDENNEVYEIMFRLAPYKSEVVFSDAHIDLMIMVRQNIDGKQRYRFYTITPELADIKSLALNWTIVHKVDGDSPLQNFKKEQFQNDNYQLLVYFGAYDEYYANSVKRRKIYDSTDVVFNRQYETMYYAESDYTTLNLNKLNNTIEKKEYA